MLIRRTAVLHAYTGGLSCTFFFIITSMYSRLPTTAVVQLYVVMLSSRGTDGRMTRMYSCTTRTAVRDQAGEERPGTRPVPGYKIEPRFSRYCCVVI